MADRIQIQAYDGKEMDCTSTLYQKYLSLTDEKEIAGLLFEQNNKSAFKPVPVSGNVVLSWDRTTSNARYTVWVSQNKDLSNPFFQTTTQDVYAAVDGLLPGKYYWKVIDTVGKESAVDTFVVKNYVRALDVDSIKNFRDLGGWETEKRCSTV